MGKAKKLGHTLPDVLAFSSTVFLDDRFKTKEKVETKSENKF